MYDERIATVMHNLEDHHLSQMLVCDPRSIQYLIGTYIDAGERFLGLVLRSGHRPVLVHNELFTMQEGLPCTALPFKDTDDSLDLLIDTLDTTAALGCDRNLPARFLIPLMERGTAASFVLASNAVDAARALKSSHEIELMRKASRTNDRAMAYLRDLVRPGVTEWEIAGQLERIYRELGAQGHSFSPIVSFGANAADPHHDPDDTHLAEGDVVLFDVGCRQDEYCADMTRSFFFRKVEDTHRSVYETVRQANEAAREFVAPGMRFCDIDATARTIIEKAGYGPRFIHRLGHQIGLDVHEPGDVSATHDEEVRPGMVFSIEPGIYLPGEVGVRIEDLVVVTEQGCEVLNSYPRELTILP